VRDAVQRVLFDDASQIPLSRPLLALVIEYVA
jgi:hypothetical protein